MRWIFRKLKTWAVMAWYAVTTEKDPLEDLKEQAVRAARRQGIQTYPLMQDAYLLQAISALRLVDPGYANVSVHIHSLSLTLQAVNETDNLAGKTGYELLGAMNHKQRALALLLHDPRLNRLVNPTTNQLERDIQVGIYAMWPETVQLVSEYQQLGVMAKSRYAFLEDTTGQNSEKGS